MTCIFSRQVTSSCMVFFSSPLSGAFSRACNRRAASSLCPSSKISCAHFNLLLGFDGVSCRDFARACFAAGRSFSAAKDKSACQEYSIARTPCERWVGDGGNKQRVYLPRERQSVPPIAISFREYSTFRSAGAKGGFPASGGLIH